ncbi:hypothetical protein [Natrinema caseinilyticum]|uniref:hypothetical protein n=1 Tax=Natrinema caseinilyticum TaxID=2961570 RepID=UPI0020C51C97|nr:hypothetical protein [Natrinema caseinilyticum]
MRQRSRLALLAGYRTRTATILSFLLLVSVQFRNPFVLNAADKLLRQVLLLAVFLPLGDRWTIDTLRDADSDTGRELNGESSVRSGKSDRGTVVRSGTGPGFESDDRVTTPATAAMLVSIVVVFVNNALRKAEGELWYIGEALDYALRQDHLTTLLGDVVATYPLFLEGATYGWTGLVTGAPLVLLLTGRRRIAYVAAFLAAVTGMALSMAVGLFPAVLAAAFLLFLPPRVWDALEGAADRVAGLERAAAVGRRATDRLPRSRPVGSVLSDPIRGWARRCWSLVLVGVLIVVVLWSVALVGAGSSVEPIDSLDLEDHQWRMFAPDPSTSYGWYVVAAQVDGGEDVDVLCRGELEADRPPDAADTIPTFRWRRYLDSIADDDELAAQFAVSMCERARTWADAPVETVTVTYTEQQIQLDGEPPPPETVEVIERSCSNDRNAELQPVPTVG